MLGRLLKHEFKATSSYYIPVIIAMVLLSLMLKLSFLINSDSIFLSTEIESFSNIVQGVLLLIYIIVISGSFFLSIFFIARRFYHNLFGDEGYLMHTLPVSGSQHLNSKLICSFVWNLILIVLALLSFFILFSDNETFSIYSYLISILINEIKALEISAWITGLFITELIVMIPVGILCSILTLYVSIAIGHHFLSSHRFIGAVLSYFVLSVINSTITSTITNLTASAYNNPALVVNFTDLCNLLLTTLSVTLIITVIEMIAYYCITRYLLNNKLDLN